MKHRPRHYAEAFVDLYRSTPATDRESVLKRFVAVLSEHGMLRYRTEIVRRVLQQLLREEGGRSIRLEFARVPSDDLLHTAARFLSKKDIVETAVNKELGAGVRVTINESQELDMSLKRALEEMFNKSRIV